MRARDRSDNHLAAPIHRSAGEIRNRTGRGLFSAILESTCADYVDPTCWRLEKLAVDGPAADISELVSSNQTSTRKGGSRGNAIEISAPKEPLSPTPAETAATPSMTASPPLENVTMPVQDSLQCVERGAWRDPD